MEERTAATALSSSGERLLFLAGPSGVGKSTVATALSLSLDLFHLDGDQHDAFKVHGLRKVWGEFWSDRNVHPLAQALRTLGAAKGREGVVVSLASRKKRLLDPDHVALARDAGIETIVLWGEEEFCRHARRRRDRENGRPWSRAKYDEGNRRAFELYGKSDYETARIDVFMPDGSRRRMEETLAAIRARGA